MRLLAWNILHGGGARRTPGIVLALLEHAADLIVISEFRTRMGGQMAGVLADHGWKHQHATACDGDRNGMIVLSRLPIEPGPCPLPEDEARRGLSVRLEGGMLVTAVHIPDARMNDHEAVGRKSASWLGLLEHARDRCAENHVILGDFNTGRHRLDESASTFTSTALLGRLATMGYADAYRVCHPDGRDWSWRSHTGRRFRLDHAYVSAPLAGRVRSVTYSHAERRERLSDHAVLTLELDGQAKN